MTLFIPSATLLFLLSVVTAIYFCLNFVFRVKYETREPPVLSSRIPFVGHVIGLIRQGPRYLHSLSKKHRLPICTLPMLGGKMYVVNSPDLVSAVLRNEKTLQLGPIGGKFTARLCDCNEESTRIIMDNIDLSRGNRNLNHEAMRLMHAVLAPGAIDHMNRAMANTVSLALDDYSTIDGSKKIKLSQWLQHLLTQASSDAVYGPDNPFKDPKVEKAFWEYENGFDMLLLKIMPSVTARTAYNGRRICAEAFENYFRNRGQERGSELIKVRWSTSHGYNIPLEDIARFEVLFSFAILVNTVPSSFWLLYNVFSRPTILSAVRDELKTILHTTTDEYGVPRHTVSISKLRSDCPLLEAALQETLRLASVALSLRQVLKDTVLNDQYLVKAGAVIQMPVGVPHADPNIWGSTVGDFDPSRFLKSNTKTSVDQRQQSATYRPFGGGSTLCPGRHFASTEILAVAAMCFLRFDMEPVEGKWTTPVSNSDLVASAITKPKPDVEVYINTKKDFEGHKLAFDVSNPDTSLT